MINCFEEIKNRLDIRTVAESYGIEVKRNNTCLCPFHDDHHPSAHIYPNAFHCFTCNAHYDVLGFVMALFGLSVIDAAKRLNDDFNLGLSFGKQKEGLKPKYNVKAEILEMYRRKRERFIQWEKESWNTIHDYLWFVRDWYEKYRPPIINHAPENYVLNNRFEYAMVHYPHAEEFANDWITSFSNEDKVGYKWVVDKMREFLDEHQNKEENPQNPESPRTKETI